MHIREVDRTQPTAADSGGPSNQHLQSQRKEVGIVRRWSLLLAGGLLWLFLAAIPALADGGPHLTSVNSGTSTLTADSCAGCHRAHTAQGEYLLAAQSEEALCLSCHGNGGTGATTNVEWGIQFVPSTAVGLVGTRTGVELGALRDGGFLKARINSADPSRVQYVRGYENSPVNTEFALSTRPKVSVLGTSQDVNSAHIDLSESAGDGIADMKTVWGKGALNSGAGTPSVTLTCVECHNPHGNGQYRILRPVPGTEADPLGEPEPMEVKAAYANFDTIVTDSQNALVVGDKVTITGLTWDVSNISAVSTLGVFTTTANHGLAVGTTVTIGGSVALTGYPAGSYTVATVPSFTTFTLATGTPGTAYSWAAGAYPTVTPTATASNAFTVTAVTNGFTFKTGPVLDYTGTTATVLRSQVAIADVSVDPDNDPSDGIENPTKNYTVLQTKGSQGVDSTFLLYARDVLAARDAVGFPGGVDDNQPAVAITSAPNTSGTTYNFQTTLPHGLAVGDLVNVASDGTIGGWTPGAGPYTVAGVGSSGSIYDRFTLVGVTLGAGGLTGTTWTVTRLGIPGDYSATGGDYFRRTVPWNPKLVNPTCDLTVAPTTDNAMSAYCGTMNDAPNGRPGTITSGPSTLIGQQAFLDQISPWCSQCHTRYYQNSNENLEVPAAEPISAISNRPVGGTKTTGEIYPMYYAATLTQYGGPAYGDKVTFAGMTAVGLNTSIASVASNVFTTTGAHGFAPGQKVMISAGVTGLTFGEYTVATTPLGTTFTLSTGTATDATYSAPYPEAAPEWYVIATGTTGSGSSGRSYFQVSLTKAGAAFAPAASGVGTSYASQVGAFTRIYQSSNSGWGYPREDSIYKFQHSTASNRACTVCHVAHGSNAAMPGQNGTTFSANVPYPGTATVSTSSRLLKVNNRGTCQMCHDPTGTVTAGTTLGNTTYALVVP